MVSYGLVRNKAYFGEVVMDRNKPYEIVCDICGRTFLSMNKRTRYCDKNCKSRAVAEKYKKLHPEPRILTYKEGTKGGATGVASEYKVIINLMERGYKVFKSVNPSEEFDCVIITNTNKLLTIEVKTKIERIPRKLPKYNADILALVFKDNSIIYIPEIF